MIKSWPEYRIKCRSSPKHMPHQDSAFLLALSTAELYVMFVFALSLSLSPGRRAPWGLRHLHLYTPAPGTMGLGRHVRKEDASHLEMGFWPDEPISSKYAKCKTHVKPLTHWALGRAGGHPGRAWLSGSCSWPWLPSLGKGTVSTSLATERSDCTECLGPVTPS